MIRLKSIFVSNATRLVVASGLAISSVAMPVNAQTLIDEAGGKARISLSGRLETLAQSIAADACYIANDIDVSTHQRDLSEAQDQLGRSIAALANGDQVLGVPSPETNSRAIKAIRIVDSIFETVVVTTDALINGSDPAAFETLSTEIASFAEASNLLATEIVSRYSDPNEVNQRDAVAIGLAGRQRSFTQMLSGLACVIIADPTNESAKDNLSETIELFELSLLALRDGLPAVGVRQPPNDGIKDELENAWAEWQELKSELQKVSDAGDADLAKIDELASSLLLHMNNVVSRYLLSIPGSENIYRLPLQAYAENELMAWFNDPMVIEAIKAQNEAHVSLLSGDIDALDKTWRAEASAGNGPLIEDLLSREASQYLKDRQRDAAGFVTEVFIMDNKGLNVAQSSVTSDYWQGDEAKWQETYDAPGVQTHISEAEFDDSTQTYQAQVSFPIIDPETGRKIGAVTLGVNLQLLI